MGNYYNSLDVLEEFKLETFIFILGEVNNRQAIGTCKDKMKTKKCLNRKNAGKCDEIRVKNKCQKTCGFCGKHYELQFNTFGQRLLFFTV